MRTKFELSVQSSSTVLCFAKCQNFVSTSTYLSSPVRSFSLDFLVPNNGIKISFILQSRRWKKKLLKRLSALSTCFHNPIKKRRTSVATKGRRKKKSLLPFYQFSSGKIRHACFHTSFFFTKGGERGVLPTKGRKERSALEINLSSVFQKKKLEKKREKNKH